MVKPKLPFVVRSLGGIGASSAALIEEDGGPGVNSAASPLDGAQAHSELFA